MSRLGAPNGSLAIALLEDDLVLRDRILVPQLADYGLPVEPLTTAAELYQRLGEAEFDIVVLDVGLPDEDGFAVTQRLRMLRPGIGVVMLTGRNDTTNRVRGLSEGADAYLTKPVEIEVLVATLQSLARRIPAGADAPAPMLKPTHWSLDPKGWRLVDPGGAAILLTKSERKFVACLLEHHDDVVDRETLARALTTEVYDFDLHRLDNLLHRLRRKVRQATDVPLPVTAVHGEGYVWVSG
ncbi:response regulator transcription factor [Luteibacter sp.]|uniref:response regulator transcription factor n=1 Tax=Luteibacter sp. TaxID=1886636 RepID=UPI003F7D885C